MTQKLEIFLDNNIGGIKTKADKLVKDYQATRYGAKAIACV